MRMNYSTFSMLLFAAAFWSLTGNVSAQWTQKGLDIDGEAANDNSGYSVSMPDSNTVAIGAPYNDGNGTSAGHVRIYHWNGTAWVQKGSDIDGEAADDWFGWSVSMPDSNTVAIGAYGNDGNGWSAGHVRIYQWNGSAWVQKGNDIDGEAANDYAGYSVSMPDSNTVAIGAPGNDGNGLNSGHVRIYRWNGTAWVQKGSDIDDVVYSMSGYSVSMPDSNTVAIGAPFHNINYNYEIGHVRIYQWNGSTWVQKGSDINGSSFMDHLGWSVSMPDSNTIAIGAIQDYNYVMMSTIGYVRIYHWNGSTWVQKGIDIDGEAAYDFSGCSVSMPDSNTVAIGAYGNDGNGSASGHVRIYQWNGTAWIQKGSDIDGEAAYDESGWSVSMPDSNTVAIGAIYNDGNGTDAGHVRIYQWNSPPLPVEFAWFRADRVGGDALLRWATASERGSDHFRVETATEVRDGKPVWRLLGTVKAAGESRELREYEFVDREPNKRGVRYYRIVEVDADGTTTESEVRKLFFDGEAGAVTVRPNPFADVLEVLLPSGEGTAHVQVEDVRGVTVWRRTVALGGVVQTLRVDASGLPAGVYTVRVITASGSEMVKVIKR